MPSERQVDVVLESIEASALAIPFKGAFRHASATRAVTQTIWVRARASNGNVGFGEGCPREYVTGESLESARAFIMARTPNWLRGIGDVASLATWVRGHAREIDANPAAWAAVELALLDLFGKAAQVSVETLLGLPALCGRFRYTAVVGDAAPDDFERQLDRYRHAGFRDFKIKLAGEHGRDAAKVRSLLASGIASDTVRADANNLWHDADTAIDDLAALGYAFGAIEEPLNAGDYEGMARIRRARGCRIVLDESVARKEELANVSAESEHWLVNLRVSKMGGLLRALDFLEEARRTGIRIIVGAHVGETSILTRAALTVAQAAGSALVAQEGAFGTHLLAHDIVDAPLMFRPGGILDADASAIGAAPGWGLPVTNA
jgi:L-alanine-DL-glutamate epimerase-like enolase superfamily enzyme